MQIGVIFGACPVAVAWMYGHFLVERDE